MRGRRLLVGGPMDGQYVSVQGREYRIALSDKQWVIREIKEWDVPVPFRYGIYRSKKIAFGTDGAHTEIEVLAYYGTSVDEGQ